MKTIILEFNGYWREINKNSVPSQEGVYCVYSCVHNAAQKTVSINKLIYIGESDNVNKRISSHDKLDDWKSHISGNETLCYSFAEITEPDRIIAEAALIFKHKPLTNKAYIDSFTFEDTHMKLSGKTANLVTSFIVKKQYTI